MKTVQAVEVDEAAADLGPDVEVGQAAAASLAAVAVAAHGRDLAARAEVHAANQDQSHPNHVPDHPDRNHTAALRARVAPGVGVHAPGVEAGVDHP